jgi:hypothetical protein
MEVVMEMMLNTFLTVFSLGLVHLFLVTMAWQGE